MTSTPTLTANIIDQFAKVKMEPTIKSIDALIDQIALSMQNGQISREDLKRFYHSLDTLFLEHTIQGHALNKPYGYAGDFMIIDKIYTHYVSSRNDHKIWDEYFHIQSAPIAVRNRKAYFKTLIKSKLNDDKRLSLLNIASGPARDLKEAYEESAYSDKLKTTCVEMDAQAIDYAKELTQAYEGHISFINKNIFRYQTDQKYDFIWSAGLFDYFEDKAFILLLKRFKEWLSPGGEIVIGNFNEDHNPSRAYMEILGDWYLIHRTETQLTNLALQAGYSSNKIKVSREPENVNLFLHLKY